MRKNYYKCDGEDGILLSGDFQKVGESIFSMEIFLKNLYSSHYLRE